MARKNRKGVLKLEQKKQKSRPTMEQRLIKFFRILLIFFYGQFFANAIFTHLIHGIPVLSDDPSALYPNLKVGLGVLMILHTILSVGFIWIKNWFLIFLR